MYQPWTYVCMVGLINLVNQHNFKAVNVVTRIFGLSVSDRTRTKSLFKTIEKHRYCLRKTVSKHLKFKQICQQKKEQNKNFLQKPKQAFIENRLGDSANFSQRVHRQHTQTHHIITRSNMKSGLIIHNNRLRWRSFSSLFVVFISSYSNLVTCNLRW